MAAAEAVSFIEHLLIEGEKLSMNSLLFMLVKKIKILTNLDTLSFNLR